MVAPETSKLLHEFLVDHKAMMRGLVNVLAHVESGDLMAAQSEADELDRRVGAHIRFEEEVLYPEVGRARGHALRQELRSEHATVRDALARLLAATPAEAEDPAFRDDIRVGLQMALEHAENCGTMISHLSEWSAAQQQEALSRLVQLRTQPVRWTEMN